MDVMRPVVANPPDKHKTAAPDFAHNQNGFKSFTGILQAGLQKQKKRGRLSPSAL
jgi:hypothetical protein